MGELTQGVSWVAVIVSFVLAFLLGWLWYSPMLFGKKWASGVGISLDEGGPFPVFAMVSQAMATFGLAWLFGITAAGEALFTIVLILLTLILFIVSNGKFAQKSNTAVAIEGGFIFAMGVIMLICQAIL